MDKLWNKYTVAKRLLTDGSILEYVYLDQADDPNRDNPSSLHLNSGASWIRLEGTKMWLNVKGLPKWRTTITTREAYIDFITNELQIYVDAHDRVSNELSQLKSRLT